MSNMQVEVLPKSYKLPEIKISTNEEFETKLDHSIKKIIKKEGFIEYEINKRQVSTNGGNYLGDLYEIDINGKTKDGKKELNIFVKTIIKNETLKIISITEAYITEMFAYKELAKVFAEIQEDANVPIDERYNMVKAYDETNSEAIMMENLNKKGFETCYRMDVMSLKFVEEAVKKLAKLHGLSFVLQEKKPRYFNYKIKTLKFPFIFSDEWLPLMEKTRQTVMSYVDEKYKEKVEKVFENLFEKYEQYGNDENIRVCLCHGDYRNNNILVKMNDGEIQELLPVDYQLIHYGCPVFDFIYFFTMGTDRNFRKAHMKNLKDLYFETFRVFLGYFDLDADLLYPQKEFEKVYNEKLDYGLITALMYLPLVFASESDVPDFSKELPDECFQVDCRYKGRVNDLIEDYIELGFM